jgi:hypothetical protein
VRSKHVKNWSSVDGKLIDLVFIPFHAQFPFTLEACGDNGGLNVHGDLPHCSPSDSILARDLLGGMGFINSLWELVEKIGQHLESYRRTVLQSTLAIFILPNKGTKFNKLTTHWKL